MKKALITGISGQDGSYLAEFLLLNGYEVHGIVLPNELQDPKLFLSNLSKIIDQISLYPANINDYDLIFKIITEVMPDECYHLAALSFVSYSFENEMSVFNINLDGTHYLLASIREIVPECKFFFAGSSEIFGQVANFPQTENTPFNPRSPYGITKASSFFLSKYYRDHHHLWTCNAISYNHESIRRGCEYVSRKITRAAAAIKLGINDQISLGNLDAKRDWGYAPEYIQAMWLMLQYNTPDDYVLSTGMLHSVRDICETAFDYVKLDYHDFVRVDPQYFRPETNIPLVGDLSKAKNELGWQPEKLFEEMIIEMVDHDLMEIRNKM